MCDADQLSPLAAVLFGAGISALIGWALYLFKDLRK